MGRTWILTDNLLDVTVLHPGYGLTVLGGELAGYESWRVADNLRDVTWFASAAVNAAAALGFDSGSGAVLFNVVVLDRGHNLGGKTVNIQTSPDAVTYTTQLTCVVPSAIGGLPTDANGCLTSEGVWIKTFEGLALSARAGRLHVPAMGSGLSPLLTGLYLGALYRFPDYLDGERNAFGYKRNHRVSKNDLSWGGVRVKRRIVNFREVRISTVFEDAADYLAFDAQVDRLLRFNHPWWVCLDDESSALAGLTRLYQLPGEHEYDPVADPLHRLVDIPLEEVIPELTL